MHLFRTHQAYGSGTKHFVSISGGQVEIHVLLVEGEAVGHLSRCTKQRQPFKTVSNLKVFCYLPLLP